MSQPITINIASIVGSGLCVASDDGEKVHDAIAEALRAGNKVALSFEDVEDLTSVFLNAAVGQLYGEFPEERIRESLSVVDAAPEDLQTLKRTTERAKEFYKDPERFHAAARGGSDDDDD